MKLDLAIARNFIGKFQRVTMLFARIAKLIFFGHSVGMKSLMATILILFGLIFSVHAQQDPDERFVAIYGTIQQGDTQAANGEARNALASYQDAQKQLQIFQKNYSQWNPGIITYRLNYLGDKIAMLQSGPAPSPNVSTNAAATGAAKAQAESENFQAQLSAAQNENTTLQAKLKEALAAQPATIDATELDRAQEQIRSLMKENELLKVTPTTLAQKNILPDTNALIAARKEIDDYSKKFADERERAEKLQEENMKMQSDLAQTGGRNADAIAALRAQNEKLHSQIGALQEATANAPDPEKIANELKNARGEIAALEDQAGIAALEKEALENKLKQLSGTTNEIAVAAARYENRINNLAAERDQLRSKLSVAEQKTIRAPKPPTTQLATLNEEVETLRARLAVDEAKSVPYSIDELALFSQPLPTSNGKKPIQEMPTGTAELVAEAQNHFANKQFDAAAEDYEKILKRDQNNGLALANLATIEMQQDKLDLAEKHIAAAVAQSPNDAYNLSTLGYLKFREEKYDDALDALSRAAKIDPDDPQIQNYLGVTLSHKGLRQQAETALRRAIQIDPSFAPAHNNLAVIYLSQDPPMAELARWHYQKALDAGQPRNPDLEKMLAEKGASVPQ
jgi:Flp pilus assembly protein TadD/predicted  nucleic acid-binding Zn-ribbon protein